jgi:NitT/TauT family transport system ATP-binding protein
MATPGTPPFILVEGLEKRFGKKAPTLRDLGLRVGAGDFVSLLGPSGCGKSTLLRLLAGLTAASAGSIRIDGMSPKAAREFISFIFQDSTLLPWRTVSANVALALEFEGISRPQQIPQVEDVLRLVGLGHVADYYPRQLSGGMKMRVSIARALVTTPRLLLMDEPFGALDEITRNRLNEEVLRLKGQQNWTAVFVTHSVHEAVFLSNRVMLIGMSPGGISREIDVPFAFPRTAALRRDPEYLKLVAVVSDALAEST